MDIKENDIIAVVRVRGIRNMKPQVKKALDIAKLHKPNHCVIYKITKPLLRMIVKIRDYVTFGKLTNELLEQLILKRGEKGSKKISELGEKTAKDIANEIISKGKTDKMDSVLRLHPPKKGWKNIKLHYPKGALGYRENMEELIKRMM